MRREIAGYLSIARNLHCYPEQVFITSGYISGLGLALRVLGLDGKKVWMEEPGFMVTRKGLELARLNIVPVPVDAEGLNVGYGIENAADAALAVVTPGQQAPWARPCLCGDGFSCWNGRSRAMPGSLKMTTSASYNWKAGRPPPWRLWTKANGSST